MRGLYGAGIYHSSQACKAVSDATSEWERVEWAGKTGERRKGTRRVKHILVSRVLLGDPQLAIKPMRDARRPAERRAGSGVCYDSVVADTDYVTYDRTQVYPEFLVTVAVD